MSKQSSASCVPENWSRHALVPVGEALTSVGLLQSGADGLRAGRLQRLLKAQRLDRVEGSGAISRIVPETDSDS
jgi:hypothetical protein